MSIKRKPLITGQYYHVYNRGVDKRDIFTDKNDVFRFIESIKEFNREDKINSLSNLRKSKSPQIGVKPLSGKNELVKIVAYCLNPNHFHFVLKQVSDGGISLFMKKILGGYTSYFNIKNSRSGSLFQGTFKSQIIVNENYFNKLLGYVNKNYLVHSIPEGKNTLIFSGDLEYEKNKFDLISKEEGEKILDIFGGARKFEKHCDEIINAVRETRGKKSLLEDENIGKIIESIPDRG